MIEIKNLSKSFENRGNLFSDLNLKIKRNEFLVIKGRSGSGKTTLVNILLGIENWESGEVMINNQSLRAIRQNTEFFKNHLKKIGYVSQFDMLLPEFTIIENLMIPVMDQLSHKNRMFKIFNLLRRMEIENVGLSYPHQLSGGELRRANLSLALIKDPELLILDEPLSNLNQELIEILYNELLQFSKGKTTIMVTHNMYLINTSKNVFDIEEKIYYQ